MRTVKPISAESEDEIIEILKKRGFTTRDEIINEIRNLQMVHPTPDKMQQILSDAYIVMYGEYEIDD